MKSLPAILCFALTFAWPCWVQASPTLNSPDGKYSVRIVEKAMPSADPDFEPFTVEILFGEKVVAQQPTYGHLLGVEWSPNGQWVAINNRQANSGDYVWIFSLPEGSCLKRPEDSVGQAWVETATRTIVKMINLPEDDVMRGWTTASGFEASGNLQVLVRLMINQAGTWDYAATVSLPELKILASKVTQAD